jgi:tetratricopeptide (TPR) repeat protein
MKDDDRDDRAIADAWEREDWAEARRLILAALDQAPEDHWLITQLAMTHYEERHYPEALELNERAMRLAPRCPLVLWNQASVLDMLGRTDEALALWNRLLKRGPEAVARDECGEGLRWARSLLNDCLYRIGLCYQKKGDHDAALRWLYYHLGNRQRGIKSLYGLKEVREKVRQSPTHRAEVLSPAIGPARAGR